MKRERGREMERERKEGKGVKRDLGGKSSNSRLMYQK